MGLFSSKTKYSAQSTTTQLMDTDTDLVEKSIITSTVSNRDLVDDLVVNILDSLAGSASRFYYWGDTRFEFGLPTGTVSFPSPRPDIAKDVISEREGAPVAINYTMMDFTNGDLFATPYLDEIYGLDDTTGALETVPTGIVYTEEDEDGNETITPVTPTGTVYFDGTIIQDDNLLQIFFVWDDEGSGSITVDPRTAAHPTPMYANADYVYNGYYLLDSNGQIDSPIKYWNYLIASEEYPQLSPDTPVLQSQKYYPIVPLQYDNKVLTDEPSYAQDVRTGLNTLNIKLNDITNALDQNPANNRDRIYIFLGAHIADDTPAVVKYFINYFSGLMNDSRYDISDYRAGNGRKNVLTITESYNFNAKISYSYITRTTVQGSIGEEGTTSSEQGPNQDLNDLVENNTNPSVGRWGTQSPMYSRQDWSTQDTYTWILRHQITDDSYVEVTVVGLTYYNWVIKREAITSDISRAFGKENTSDGNKIFCIPLNYGAMQELSLLEAHYVVQNSARMKVDAWDKQKIKWYQSSFGKILLLIIIIVVVVVVGILIDPGTAMTLSNFLSGMGTAALNAIYANIAITAAGFVTDVLGLENTFLGDLIETAVVIAAMFFAQGGGTELAYGGIEALATPEMFMSTVQGGIGVYSKAEQRSFERDLDRERAEYERDKAEWEEQLEYWDETEDEYRTYDAKPPEWGNALFTDQQAVRVLEPVQTIMRRTLNPFPIGGVFDQMHNFFGRAVSLPKTSNDPDFIKIHLG